MDNTSFEEPTFLELLWEELQSINDVNDTEKIWDIIQIIFLTYQQKYRQAVLELSGTVGAAMLSAWFRYSRNRVNEESFVGMFLRAMMIVDAKLPDVLEVIVGEAGERAAHKVAERFAKISGDVPAEVVETLLRGLLNGAHNLRKDGKPITEEQANVLSRKLFREVKGKLAELQTFLSSR